MRPLRVNADYEVTLFSGNSGPETVNQSLEYLLWFVEERPLFSKKSYRADYLDHVEAISGKRPRQVSAGEWENWWGPLTQIPLEQKLNSKLTSAEVSEESQIVFRIDQLRLAEGRTYLAKPPNGMSGQGFVVFEKGNLTAVAKLLGSGPLIVEPLFERLYDFSHYVLDRGMICYENLVDQKFQYKGTRFSDLSRPEAKRLSFAEMISPEEWNRFDVDLQRVIAHYKSLGATSGYSIDSFVYREEGTLKIRTVSEVNYRRTMGLLAFELSKKYAGLSKATLFVLGPPVRRENAFQYIRDKISPISWDAKSSKGVLQLSPGDTRFECFLVTGDSPQEVGQFHRRLKELLPDCKFSVDV